VPNGSTARETTSTGGLNKKSQSSLAGSHDGHPARLIESESTATQPTKSAVLKVIAGLATVMVLTSTDIPNTIVPVVWIDGSAGGTIRAIVGVVLPPGTGSVRSVTASSEMALSKHESSEVLLLKY
jgi:hypothetical protein